MDTGTYIKEWPNSFGKWPKKFGNGPKIFGKRPKCFGSEPKNFRNRPTNFRKRAYYSETGPKFPEIGAKYSEIKLAQNFRELAPLQTCTQGQGPWSGSGRCSLGGRFPTPGGGGGGWGSIQPSGWNPPPKGLI